jgi:acyl-CoA synthetase (AMP-forming)/AMP-acid ligase II
MFSGYYRDEDATAEAFRGGWFHSGDMVRHGEDGLRVMVDRYKDVIKSGGENVSSLRVEAVLAQHPDVARAATVGVPDSRWGEVVTAVVVARDGAQIDQAELIAFCRARLAGYETPKRVVLVDELPATVGGKVLKYQLRERLTAGDLQ